MLQQLQKILHQWVIKAIVVLIMLSFALWGVQVWFERGNQTVIAKVGKYQITLQELRDQARILSSVWQGQSEEVPILARQELIQQSLFKNLLDQIDGWLKVKDLALLNSYPKVAENTSLAYLPENSQKARAASLVNLASQIRVSGFNLDGERARMANILQQERFFDYVEFSVNDISKVVNTTEAEVKDYYQQHANELVLPKKVRLYKLKISRKTWQQQLTKDERLKVMYQRELEKLNRFYQDKNVSELSSTIKQAEINAQRQFAETVVRELKYNPSDFKEIAESYGLTWSQLPEISEADLNKLDELDEKAFDIRALFEATGAAGWVFNSPLNFSGHTLISQEDLAGQTVVILWREKAPALKPENLAQAAPIIKAKLARTKAAASLESTASALASRWNKGGSVADYLLKYRLTLKKGRARLNTSSPSVAARIALSECAFLDESKRAAWRCDESRCLVVRVTKVDKKDASGADANGARSDATKNVDDAKLLAMQNSRGLEQQALSLPSDKIEGIKFVEPRVSTAATR